MPRNYKRKTQRQSWSEESMSGAIREVLEGSMGYKRAALAYNIPQSTLEDRVKKVRQNNLSPVEAAKKRLGRCNTVFSEAQEREIVEHLLLLEQRLFGLTLTDLQQGVEPILNVNVIPVSNIGPQKSTSIQLHPSIHEPSTLSQLHLSIQEPSASTQLHPSIHEPSTLSQLHLSIQEPSASTQLHPSIHEPSTSTQLHPSIQEPSTYTQQSTSIHKPSTSTQLLSPVHLPTSLRESSFAISPKILMPPPQEAERVIIRSNRRRGKTAILTSSPYKSELETCLTPKKNQGKQMVKKRVFVTEEKKKLLQPKKIRKMEEHSSSDEENDKATEACIFCNELYANSRHNDGWIQCTGCHRWAHEACSGAEETDDTFICDFCN